MPYYDSTSNTMQQGTAPFNPNNPQIGQLSPGGAFASQIAPIPQVPSTMDASALQTSNPLTLPATPSPTTSGVMGNTSVVSPIPSAENIINQGAISTPTEQKQQGMLDRIAGLIGVNKSQADLTSTAENNAGLPKLTSTLNDLNTQLQGLNDQATSLQNEANVIPLQTQGQYTGTGATTGGIAPKTHAQIADNAIKQNAIASQSLTLKSAIYGAQGQYNIAKDAADKAAEAQFENQQQQLDYQKAQLDAIAPTLNKEEKAQAAIQIQQLADRQTQIDNAKDDKKTILAMASATLKLYPNDPKAQYAAQEALAESNRDQPDLQKVLGLIGQYQQDPQAVALQVGQLQAQRDARAQSVAATAKDYNDIKVSNQKTILPTTTDVTTALNKLIDSGYSSSNDVTYTDADGYLTKVGFNTLVKMAGENGMSRQDFLKQYGSKLAPDKGAAKNYGLTPAEIKSI